MGAHPYWYIEPYDPDLGAVLERLRQREFRAGRYNPVMRYIEFPIAADSPSPGARHASIEKALKAADADGTRSILDISAITSEPEFSAASPLPDDMLEQLYGTTQPTRAAVEANMDFFDDLERGQAIYIVLYDNGRPTEVLFAGYSFD
jgi:hypothetical protein